MTVLDAIGASLSDASQDRLKQAGVQAKWFNPLRFWTLEETN